MRQSILVIPLVLMLFAGCAVSERTCIQENVDYCTVRGNFTGQWYDYYERAVSCMSGGCYDAALADLTTAIDGRSEDQRRARTVGMHFIDYFPHREKGIVHYFQGEYELARQELEASLFQYPSEKARFYLDAVRRRLLEQASRTPSVPRLVVQVEGTSADGKEIWTSDDPVVFSGTAIDETQYISEIVLGGVPVFLEASDRKITFTEKRVLDPGTHEISVAARNLLGGEAQTQVIIHVDRTGPVIALEKFIPGETVEGVLTDDAGGLVLQLDGEPVPVPPGNEVSFSIPLDDREHPFTLTARDRLGNETRLYLGEDMSARHSGSILMAANASDMAPPVPEPAPAIILKDWFEGDTIYKAGVQVPIEISSTSAVEEITINGRPVRHHPGRMMAFEHFLRLQPGENQVTVAIRNRNGRSTAKDFTLIRRIPEAFQLKYRYSFAMHPFEGMPPSPNQAAFQYRLAEDVAKRNRFRMSIREELQDILAGRELPVADMTASDNVHAVLLGIIHETGDGIEIAVRLVDVSSRETLATADVYSNQKTPDTIAALARRLSEKLHRDFPLVDCRVMNVRDDGLLVTPEEWQPVRGKLRTTWPLLVYRFQDNPSAWQGAETEILSHAQVEAVRDEDRISVVLKNTEPGSIRTGDKVISR